MAVRTRVADTGSSSVVRLVLVAAGGAAISPSIGPSRAMVAVDLRTAARTIGKSSECGLEIAR